MSVLLARARARASGAREPLNPPPFTPLSLIRLPFDDARLVAARQRVVAACRAAGKIAGILCALPEQVAVVRGEGYSFVSLGSDMAAAATGIRNFAAALA